MSKNKVSSIIEFLCTKLTHVAKLLSMTSYKYVPRRTLGTKVHVSSMKCASVYLHMCGIFRLPSSPVAMRPNIFAYMEHVGS